VQASYRPPAEAKGLALDLVGGKGLASIVMDDPVRIGQILGNFIANAIKFTARGTRRSCGARRPGTCGKTPGRRPSTPVESAPAAALAHASSLAPCRSRITPLR
jgi:hypothetical protein